MKNIPSPLFRKTYPRLTETVVVTVHGHPIGVWEPYTPGKHVIDKNDKMDAQSKEGR